MNLKISHPIIIFWLSIIIFYGLNDASSSQSVFPTNEVSWLPASEYRSYHDISKDWNYSNNLLNKPISITLPYEFPVNTITVITKNIKIDSVNTNRQFSLLAYGIQIRCRVFVNKTFIGSHKGGSTSFEFSIPRHILLFNRDNEVTIEIDSPLGSPDEIPVRIRPYGIPPVSGALFQNIFLVTSPEFGFQQIDASYDIDGLLSSGIVHLKFKMRNPFKSDSNHTVTQSHHHFLNLLPNVES